jgi:hypothetical protein
MVAPITVAPIIPLGPDTIINGNPYQIAGRPTPQPLSSPAASIGSMGLGGYTPQQSANVTNLLRAALPAPQTASAPALPALPASSLMGLFRDRNPLAQGLLAAGKALTDYGAPSTMPKGGFMGALGAGGQGFMTGYQAGEDANLANRLAAYKLYSDGRQKPFAVGNRVYDPNPGGGFISATGTDASAQPPTGVNYTPLELEQYRALADDPEEQVKFIERINKVRDDAHRNFRTEIRPFAKQLQEIDRKTSVIFASLAKKNGTADITAINAFQRMVDDGVVRSDDVALQASARSLRDSVVAQLENIKKGDLLPQSVRDNMTEMTRVLLSQTLPGIEAGIAGVEEIVGMDERLDFNRVFSPSFRTFLERARANVRPATGSSNTSVTEMPTSLGD